MEAVFGENCSFLSSTLFIRSIPGVSREYLRSIYGVTRLHTVSTSLSPGLLSLSFCQVPYYQCYVHLHFAPFCQLRTNVDNKGNVMKCGCPNLDVLAKAAELSALLLIDRVLTGKLLPTSVGTSARCTASIEAAAIYTSGSGCIIGGWCIRGGIDTG
jgi:hypothetical protein